MEEDLAVRCVIQRSVDGEFPANAGALDSRCPRCAVGEREHREFCFTEPELERRMN